MTAKRQIIISKEDHERLEGLFVSDNDRTVIDQPNLQSLRRELDIATIVAPEEIPPDVVTVNSTVQLCDSRSSYKDTYTLVYPEDALSEGGKLSVLDAIGTAILGYRVGDLVQWSVPGGSAQFHIGDLVFQPERDSVFL